MGISDIRADGPEGCGETIIINGREITLQANAKVTVDLRVRL
jgi:hypothetical protein